MSKYFKSITLFFSVIFFLSSCNEEKGNNETTNSASNTATSANTEVAVQAKGITLVDTLYKLWIEADSVKELKKIKLVLSFTLQGDFLTLYGWSCKKRTLGGCAGKYNNDANFKLKKGLSSGVPFGPNIFFENVYMFF